MKKHVLIFIVLSIATIFSTMLPMRTMNFDYYKYKAPINSAEPLSIETKNKNVHRLIPKQPAHSRPYDQTDYELNALDAELYNLKNPLLSMIPIAFDCDVMVQILLCCYPNNTAHITNIKKRIKAKCFLIENIIKNAMQLRSTCKDLNKLITLQRIGNMCSHYDPLYKDKVLFDIAKSMHAHNYETKRVPALILIYADANPLIQAEGCDDILLQNAVLHDDEQMIKVLFKNKANANARCHGEPLFYHVKTVKIAQIFVTRNCEIHTQYNEFCPNVLWRVLHKNYPSELLSFYLMYEIDAKTTLDCSKEEMQGGNCLLHELANPTSLYIHDVQNFLRKGHILLAIIPKMINKKNNDGKTPTDLAHESFKAAKTHGKPKAFKRLIALFKEHGGIRTKS